MEEQFHLISLDLLPRVFFGDLLSALFILLPPPPSGDARGFPVEEASVSGQPSRQRKQEVPAWPFAASGSPLGHGFCCHFLVLDGCSEW